ncbi:MAG: cysteine desulfurase/selenocysteine lyase [Cyclobacteriaceae bacterium]|jgi:cysteine desulfurase/selenocysteine lyase
MESTVHTKFDINEIRKQFPVLDQTVNGKPLIYFDNAATSQKPNMVIDALMNYYRSYNANIHRGIHTLAERATAAYENTRKATANFINAAEPEEIIFTRGTTEGINLVAQSYGRTFLKAGDEILISAMEHHSNIVPWQLLCEQTGAVLKVADVSDRGEMDMASFDRQLSDRTKIVSIVYISNTLGTINPVKDIITKAHAVNAVVLLDAAQATPHTSVDVQSLNVDFLALSSHKMYGPTGTGVLYGKRRLLEKMAPYQGGGEMIKDVSFAKTTYNEIPYKFEAGTPNIADVIGFGKAIEFIQHIGIENIAAQEDLLLQHANELISSIDGFEPVGTADHKAGVLSFNFEGIHPFDLGVMLDAKGIAIRTGHHCTQPLMDRYGIEGTARASFAVYNTIEEVDAFIEGLEDIIKKLR